MNNSTNNNTEDIPDAILELLPWFVTGKLSIDDQLLFENALQTYPSLQQQLKREQQVIALVSADHTLLDKSLLAPPEVRLQSVFNTIDNPEPAIKSVIQDEPVVKRSLLERLKNTFDTLIPKVFLNPQYARIASVSVLAISIAVLASLITPTLTEKNVFIPASADVEQKSSQSSLATTEKTVLLIGFNGTAEELSNNAALKGKQINIVSPADKGGFFQVSFTGPMSADEVKQTVDALLAQEEIIWFAGEAF